jgi:hypothetical protein
LQEVSFSYKVHQPYFFTLISFVHSPLFHKYSIYTLYCLSLLILNLMFKEVSQCISNVSILYFGPFKPSITLPYPFPPTPHFSTAFSTYSYILYLHRCYVSDIVDALSAPLLSHGWLLCHCWHPFLTPRAFILVLLLWLI